MSKQIIKYAKTHAQIFVPSIGALSDTLPPNNKTVRDFQMTRTDLGGIRIDCISTSGTREVLEIPAGDIAFMVYGPLIEDPAPKAAPKVKNAKANTSEEA